jgi:hypothetical protein
MLPLQGFIGSKLIKIDQLTFVSDIISKLCQLYPEVSSFAYSLYW